MSHIEREIHEQPEIIARLLDEEQENVQRVAAAIHAFDPAFIVVAARGTSDNAGRYAQYLFGIQAGLPVALAAPSVHTLYHAPPKLERAVVIGISQSGQAEDVRQVLADAHAQGALTIAITNAPESPLTHTAGYHLPLRAGEEISIAATKTYTAQLTVIALLAAALAGDGAMQDAVRRLPQWAAATLALSGSIAARAERYRYMERFVALGRGYNYCTAFEVSLKIKELCYVAGEAYSEADFRHGPIALMQPGFPALLVAPAGKTAPLMRDLLAILHQRGAECLVISDDDALLTQAHTPLPLPHDIPEWLSPIVAVIPGQIFAMYLALVRGYPVDRPRGLNKVTVTR